MEEKKFKVITRWHGGKCEETYTLEGLLAHILNVLAEKQSDYDNYSVDKHEVKKVE